MAAKPYRPAAHVLARNIRTTFDAATADDIARGAAWYADARAAAYRIARPDATQSDADAWLNAYRSAVPVDVDAFNRAAGVIAALSPQNTWQDNLAAARAIYAGQAPKFATAANVTKARRIHAGEAPDDVLGGPKVRAFYLNIIGDPDVVTVDRHAVDAARGRRGAYATHNTTSRHVHAAFVDAYRRVAADVGHTPAELQAIVWCAWRRIHDTASHRADVAA